jgi:fibronectin type 3 domain-containing protein
MRRGAAFLLLATLAGCSTSVDLEHARETILGKPQQPIPILYETPASNLPPPTGLRAESKQLRQIPLSWDPIGSSAVSGYVLERSLTANGPFERMAVITDRFATSYTDTGFDLARKKTMAPGLGDGASYYYRLRSYDASGHISSAASDVANATTAAVPSAPEALRAYSQLPRKIALAWQPVEDPTVAGYVVLRSPSATGSFDKIARLDGRFATTYIDPSLGDLRVFYYRVAAFNAAGGQGKPTEAVRAVTKADPLAPAGLEIAGQSLGRNVLRWTPNVERDVSGYRVLRRRVDATKPEVVATLPPSETTVEDTQVGADEAVRYSLVALDADGLESAESDPLEVVSKGYGLHAEAKDRAVELSWQRSDNDGFDLARIERSGMLGNTEVARERGDHYVDTDVSPGRKYRYVVVLMRADGSSAPPSEPIEVEVPES